MQIVEAYEIEDTAIPRRVTAHVARLEGLQARSVRRHKQRPAGEDYPFGSGTDGPLARFCKRVDALEESNPSGAALEVAAAVSYYYALTMERRLSDERSALSFAEESFTGLARHYANLIGSYIASPARASIASSALHLLQMQAEGMRFYGALCALFKERGGESA